MVAILREQQAPGRADFHQAISARGESWYAVCLRITRDPDLAEDAVQDALLSAWNKRHQFTGSSRLETWIHRIVVNSALQLIRKKKPDSLDLTETDIPDNSARPDAAMAESQLDDQLATAMGELTDMERVCFVLKHLEQWQLREIADEIDANVNTVKQALFRGVRKLRPQMQALKGATP